MRWLLICILMGGLLLNCSSKHRKSALEVGHAEPIVNTEPMLKIPPSFSKPMHQESVQDLQWVKVLVLALNAGGVTIEQTIAFLGEKVGTDPWDSTRQLVKPWSIHIQSATVYPLLHIDVPVAVNIEFKPGSTPELTSLQELFGEFRRVRFRTDDFSGRKYVLAYYRPEKAPMNGRILAALLRSNEQLVVRLKVDAEKFLE